MLPQEIDRPDVSVAKALQDAAAEAKWSRTRIAYVAGVSVPAIVKFERGETKSLKGDSIIALMFALPGFAQRLGFAIQDSPHSMAV